MFTTRQRAAAAAALAVTALTAGCIGGLPVGSSVDAAVVEERVEQRYAALDGYGATVTRTVEVGDQTTEATARVRVRRGDGRTVTYTDGPRAGETVTASADSAPVFGAPLGASESTPATFGALAASLVRANNVTVDRVTTHDGHRTAVLELTPENDSSAADRTHRVWVDLDRRIPLKVVTTWTTADGETATVTVEYEDVTLYERNDSGGAEVTA
ncbi:MAG: outer membrane lipoprotein-sorting protein [Halobacterium sp.]